MPTQLEEILRLINLFEKNPLPPGSDDPLLTGLRLQRDALLKNETDAKPEPRYSIGLRGVPEIPASKPQDPASLKS